MDKPTVPDEPKDILTPSEVAARLKIRERYLRKFARDTGHCRIFGNRMVFTSDDVAALPEASKPIPKITFHSQPNIRGICHAVPKPYPRIDYTKEALRLAADSYQGKSHSSLISL